MIPLATTPYYVYDTIKEVGLQNILDRAESAVKSVSAMGLSGKAAVAGAGLALAGAAIGNAGAVKDAIYAATPHINRGSTIATLHSVVPVLGSIGNAMGAGAATAAAAPAAAILAPVVTAVALGYLTMGSYEAYRTTTPDGKYAIAKKEHTVPITALARDDALAEVETETQADKKILKMLPLDSDRRKIAEVEYHLLLLLNRYEEDWKQKDSPEEPIQSRDKVIQFLETPL